MPRVLPFRGLRFNPNVAGELETLVCPPYDVISPAERQMLQRQSPYNAVHVELPEDAEGQPGSRYGRAAGLLAEWRSDRALEQDPNPAYYAHETEFTVDGEVRRRRDLFAALGVEPWSTRAVLPHEHTLAGPKVDRLALLKATHVNISPIWVLYRDEPKSVKRAWAEADSREPDQELRYDSETHRIWVLDNPELVDAIKRDFAKSNSLYIADGHHRYETALAFGDEVGDAIPGARQTLAILTSGSDPTLIVLPTHRMLRKLPDGTSFGDVITSWERWFEVEPRSLTDGSTAKLEAELAVRGHDRPAFIALGPDGQAFLLVARDPSAIQKALPADRSAAWKALDLAVLHELVLEPLVAAVGESRDDLLVYTRDAQEAADLTKSGEMALAVLTNPTKVAQLLDVADASDRMPQKSTFFFPKPPTGLVIRPLD